MKFKFTISKRVHSTCEVEIEAESAVAARSIAEAAAKCIVNGMTVQTGAGPLQWTEKDRMWGLPVEGKSWQFEVKAVRFDPCNDFNDLYLMEVQMDLICFMREYIDQILEHKRNTPTQMFGYDGAGNDKRIKRQAMIRSECAYLAYNNSDHFKLYNKNNGI